MTQSKQKGGMKVEDFLAQLERDPEWVKQRDERERVFAEKEAQLSKAEEPLVAALRKVGFKVDSVWDLVNTSEPYPEAIPVLLEHIDKDYPNRIREGIARSLAVYDAIVGWPKIKTAFLTDPFPTTDVSHSKWAWGLALGASANDSVLEEVIELLKNPAHGRDRAPLIQVLLRSKDPRAKKLLEELESDPVIGKDAKMARKKGRWPWSR